MKTLEEILSLEDVERKIYYLKKGRKTQLPDREKLYADWDPNKHEIFDKEKYPQIEITIEQERTEYDEKSGKSATIPAKKKKVDPNRIALPLEQDIVNIQTAFTVGTEPKMDCTPDESEKGLFEALKQVLKKNKIKYQNRKIVRAWLSEQECAEYWYVTKDDGFWAKLKAKVANLFGKSMPQYKLRSVLWSPFRGDKLYPFLDDSGDMVAFSREYKKKDLDDHEITCFMTVTKDMVYQWELDKGWQLVSSFKHGFKKLPVIYSYRSEAYCDKIHTIRVRLEKLLSSYADCIDYHFFPILKLFGDVEKMSGEFRNRVVQLTGEGADASYLTWNQASDPVKVEFENHFNQAYALTNTPRISFENLKGTGNALSGEAFRYVFMGAHMAVENHSEEIGSFMQRRVNFLVSALGSINTNFEKASETIDVDVEIVPYMIDNVSDKVSTAVSAVNGGIWSRREGIIFAGNMDRIDEELKEIEEEQVARKNEILKTEHKNAS
jgi:uncharacterized protein YggL (DUF469 family)